MELMEGMAGDSLDERTWLEKLRDENIALIKAKEVELFPNGWRVEGEERERVRVAKCTTCKGRMVGVNNRKPDDFVWYCRVCNVRKKNVETEVYFENG